MKALVTITTAHPVQPLWCDLRHLRLRFHLHDRPHLHRPVFHPRRARDRQTTPVPNQTIETLNSDLGLRRTLVRQQKENAMPVTPNLTGSDGKPLTWAGAPGTTNPQPGGRAVACSSVMPGCTRPRAFAHSRGPRARICKDGP